MTQDQLSNALSTIANYERQGKRECTVKSSKLIKNVLAVMQAHGYIGSYKEIQSIRGNKLIVNLIGAINKCGVIKPRYPMTLDEFTKFEVRYLPAKGFGILILSTPKGIVDNETAMNKKTGGRLLAYCY